MVRCYRQSAVILSFPSARFDCGVDKPSLVQKFPPASSALVPAHGHGILVVVGWAEVVLSLMLLRSFLSTARLCKL